MKRLFLGLTLLLMSFLAAVEPLDGLRDLVAGVGVYRWVPELVLALAAVALFARTTRLHRRLLFPRRGGRLLAAGIAAYAIGAAAAAGLIVGAIGLVPIEKDSVLAAAPALAAQIHPLPLLVAAQLLLLVGVFRAMTNLVPPSEYEVDY